MEKNTIIINLISYHDRLNHTTNSDKNPPSFLKLEQTTPRAFVCLWMRVKVWSSRQSGRRRYKGERTSILFGVIFDNVMWRQGRRRQIYTHALILDAIVRIPAIYSLHSVQQLQKGHLISVAKMRCSTMDKYIIYNIIIKRGFVVKKSEEWEEQ